MIRPSLSSPPPLPLLPRGKLHGRTCGQPRLQRSGYMPQPQCVSLREADCHCLQWANGAAFNVSFSHLQPGDTLIVPNKTFHLVGGAAAPLPPPPSRTRMELCRPCVPGLRRAAARCHICAPSAAGLLSHTARRGDGGGRQPGCGCLTVLCRCTLGCPGIIAENLRDVTVQFDGTLVYAFEDTVAAAEEYIRTWPRSTAARGIKSGKVLECMHFHNFSGVRFTSSGVGTFEGRGQKWWGIPGIGYLTREENRPRLINIESGSEGIVFENLYLHESPYWTLNAHVSGMEISNVRRLFLSFFLSFCFDQCIPSWPCAYVRAAPPEVCGRARQHQQVHINNRRTNADGHGVIDETAFNTDGFDVSGDNVWIHDCSIWNQDDCIAVKDGSNDMLFERIEASGIGLTIGSIGGSRNNNITFRDCHMHETGKGIYMKFRGDGGVVSNVTYAHACFECLLCAHLRLRRVCQRCMSDHRRAIIV
eukprot:COSAG01_NODE_8526_length_2752_cov_29.698455_2_plen_476_part_00